MNEFTNKSWSLSSVKKLLTMIDQMVQCSVDRKMMATDKFAFLFRAKQLLRKYPEFSHNGFQMINFYFCSTSEPSK